MVIGPSSTSTEEIFSLTHNAVSVICNEDGFFQALRFTDMQRQAASTHALYRSMSKTSASVCLRFFSRSEVNLTLKRYNESLLPRSGDLAFDFSALYGRPFDIVETIDLRYGDDEVIEHPLKSGVITIEPDKMVTIYLPMHHQIGFKLEGDVESLKKQEKVLLCMGDSIIQGVGIHHPSQALCEHLSRILDMQVINQGLAGAMVNPKIVDSIGVPVSSILIGLGTNDWVVRNNLAELRGEMFAMLGRVRKFYPNVPITLLTPLWRSDILEPKHMGTFSEMQKTLAEATYCCPKIRVADGLSLSLRNAYDDGYLHPNAKAVAFLAKGLAQQL